MAWCRLARDIAGTKELVLASAALLVIRHVSTLAGAHRGWPPFMHSPTFGFTRIKDELGELLLAMQTAMILLG